MVGSCKRDIDGGRGRDEKEKAEKVRMGVNNGQKFEIREERKR